MKVLKKVEVVRLKQVGGEDSLWADPVLMVNLSGGAHHVGEDDSCRDSASVYCEHVRARLC
jgi:hypothetical protein